MRKQFTNLLFDFIIASCFFHNTIATLCDVSFGPSGGINCIKLPEYDTYQWSVCRNTFELLNKWTGRIACDEKLEQDYCSHQCMLDRYGIKEGNVSDSCKCSLSDSVPEEYKNYTEGITLSPQTPQARCLELNGSNCQWYKECFNEVYRSCEHENQYLINFLQSFCEMPEREFKGLSSNVTQWLDATRRCIQLEILQLINSTKNVESCMSIRSLVLNHYKKCYLTPDELSLPYCSLPREDRMMIFWLQRLESQFGSYEPNLKTIVDIINTCQDVNVKDLINKAKIKTQEELSKINVNNTVLFEHDLQVRINVWVDNPPSLPIRIKICLSRSEENKESYYVGKIIDILAKRYDWKGNNIIWFAYPEPKTHGESIQVLLDDGNKYKDTVYNLTSSNLKEALLRLSRDVPDRITFDIRGYKQYGYIVQLDGCFDQNCYEKAFSVDKSTLHKATYFHVVIALFLTAVRFI